MGWIKIKDRPPKEGQRVITYFEITGIEIATYYHPKPIRGIDGIEHTDCFQNKSGFLCDDVTHWMPLPDKPTF